MLTERQLADLVHAALQAAGQHFSAEFTKPPLYALNLLRRYGDDTPACEVYHVPTWAGNARDYAETYCAILSANLGLTAVADIHREDFPPPRVIIRAKPEQQ